MDVAVQIDVIENGHCLTSVTASGSDPNLTPAGWEDVTHRFAVDLANLLRDNRQHTIEFHVDGAVIPGGQLTVGPFGVDGIVRYPGYLDTSEQLELLTLPFEHYFYDMQRMRQARAHRRLG